jgi:hypothetical protein
MVGVELLWSEMEFRYMEIQAYLHLGHWANC